MPHARRWSDARKLTAILAAAFVLRLVCAVGLQWHLDHGTKELCLIAGDADGYWQLAGKIVRGENFEIYQPPRQVMRMPGFPVLLAIPQTLFGDNVLAVRIWLAMIGTSACWFTYLLGKDLCNATVGLWAAAITAVSPVLALFSVLLLSETPFAAAMTASLVALVRLHRTLKLPAPQPVWWWAGASGLLIAVATYIRPTWLLVAPMAAVLMLLVRRGSPDPAERRAEFWRRISAAAILCLVCYAALLPWGYRNWKVTGHWTVTTFWVGPSLYDGLNPQANGDSEMTFFDEENLLGRMSEYEMDREYRRRAWDYARQNPGRALQLMGIKLARYAAIWPNAAQFQQPWMQAVVAASFSMILFPALYGTWCLRQRWDVLIAAWGPILYFAAIHMLFVGSIRYRLPAEYALAVLSGVGMSTWFKNQSMVEDTLVLSPRPRGGEG